MSEPQVGTLEGEEVSVEDDALQAALSAMFAGQMQDEESRRTITITLPTIDTLGLQEGAPTLVIQASGKGNTLTIDAHANGEARSQEEYDAMIHLIGLSI